MRKLRPPPHFRATQLVQKQAQKATESQGEQCRGATKAHMVTGMQHAPTRAKAPRRATHAVCSYSTHEPTRPTPPPIPGYRDTDHQRITPSSAAPNCDAMPATRVNAPHAHRDARGLLLQHQRSPSHPRGLLLQHQRSPSHPPAQNSHRTYTLGCTRLRKMHVGIATLAPRECPNPSKL